MNTEVALTQIWERVIGVKQLQSSARFLDVGGNSLNLVQVLKEVEQCFGYAPSPRMFFDRNRSTIATIAAAIDAKLGETPAIVSAAPQM